MPLHAAIDQAALRPGPAGIRARDGRARAALAAALIAATVVLAIGATGALAATFVTPKCDAVNLRTGPSTTYAKKTSVNEGALLTIVKKVDGGSYATSCGGSLSGHYWYKISAIDGQSVSSRFGVSYLYGASKLFQTVTIATPTPVPATASPVPSPAADPTADPGASADPGSPPPSADPSVPPSPSADPTPPPGPVALPATVTFYGRGYGHGVGMSQYGAYGRAIDGWLASDIVATYYQGTTLGNIANVQVRVRILAGFAASSTNPVQVYGRGGSWTIDGVSATFPADARLRFTPSGSGTSTTWRVTVTASDGTTLYSAASPRRIRVRPSGGTTLQLWSKPSAYDRYRGVLRIIGKKDSTKVKVINELAMESYLRGVVPAEVSASWPTEAVKAQAIAARSYAAYRLHPGTGTFDLKDTTASQVYLGYLAEKSGSNSAITATSGLVVLAGTGKIANTLFHSCAGGWTENNENVYVSSTGAKVAGVYSYLRGVSDRRPDGSSYDDASPYDTWKTRAYSLADLQAWFAADSRTNVGTLVALDLRDRGVSGRLISVTLIGANGSTKKVSGDVFRAVFNAHRPSADPMMRSSLFDLTPIP